MRRIGVLVALLLLALASALTLLVGRALQSVASEQAMRHEVLAERVFDEIEEQLTTLIETEEVRPFLQYRFFYVPESQVPGTVGLSRSPLSEVPAQPWLLGWFQVDPDGSVTTPLEPDDAAFASASIGWVDSDDLRRRSDRLREVGAALSHAGAPPSPETEDRLALQDAEKPMDGSLILPVQRSLVGQGQNAPPPPSVAPVSTRVEPKKEAPTGGKDKAKEDQADGWSGLEQAAVSDSRRDLEASGKKSESKNADPYGIGTLNTGASKRGERQQRVTKTSAENVRNYQFPADNEALRKGTQLPEVGFEGETANTLAAASEANGGEAESGGLLGGLLEGIGVGSGRRDAGTTADASWSEGVEGEADSELAAVEAEVAAAQDEASVAPAPVEEDEEREKARGGGGRWANRPGVEASSASRPSAPAPTKGGQAPQAASAERAADRDDPWIAEPVAVASPAPSPPSPDSASLDALSSAGGATWQDVSVQRQAPDASGASDGSPVPGQAKGAPAVQTPRARPRILGPVRPSAGTQEDVDVEISPLRGRLIDDETLVLFRTVRIGGQQYVQGLALLLPLLQGWLEEQVLAGSDLRPFLRLDWGADAGAIKLVEPPADFRFAHTFAEPFTSLAATARLWALPEASGTGRSAILQLTVLLVVVGALGLLALWRMVSVVVHFAQRRQNFVAAVSHELKTPLTAIRMYSEMLRDGYVQTDEKRAEYYATMSAESERLSRLIQNVLELSRLENDGGRGSGEVVVGALGPVLEEATRVLERHAAERGFRIVLDLPASLPPVRFERDGLLQVLINLLDNGIKFSHDAALREVRVEARAEGGRVVLRVRDHGPGVPARQLGHLFQPFYRGERELTRRTKGTGIGLALVKGIVERMGGSVSARNHPEGGFEVKVALGAA